MDAHTEFRYLPCSPATPLSTRCRFRWVWCPDTNIHVNLVKDIGVPDVVDKRWLGLNGLHGVCRSQQRLISCKHRRTSLMFRSGTTLAMLINSST